MWISFRKNSIEPDLVRINDSCLERVTKFKLLLDLPTGIGITIYCSKIRTILEYVSPVWGGLTKCELERIVNRLLDFKQVNKKVKDLNSRIENDDFVTPRPGASATACPSALRCSADRGMQ